MICSSGGDDFLKNLETERVDIEVSGGKETRIFSRQL